MNKSQAIPASAILPVKKPLFISLVVLVSQLAVAEPDKEAPPPENKPLVVEALSLRPGEHGYSQELVALGIQGSAEISARLAPDGTLSSIALKSTSRSEALDRLALDLVRTLKFKPKEDRKPDMDIVVPVEFMRDSLATLGNKTCADFNVDVAYFKKTYPEKTTRDMSVINMAAGTFYLLGSGNGSMEKKVQLAKGVNVAASSIEETCAGNPDEIFMKAFARLAR